MAKTVPIRPKSKKTVHYKAVFAHLLAEMDCLDEQMDRDHAESERLKVETELIKARTNAKLARLQEQINSLSRAV